MLDIYKGLNLVKNKLIIRYTVLLNKSQLYPHETSIVAQEELPLVIHFLTQGDSSKSYLNVSISSLKISQTLYTCVEL